MNKYKLYAGLVGAGAIALVSVAWQTKVVKQPEQARRRPNIIVILADDMGFSDLGCYGGEVNTPNINYLAQNGIRYRQFYNTSRCCPTRASLLTVYLPVYTISRQA